MEFPIRPQIQELSKQVADKIAAGEVVDRPVSIVKELLENAIDAKATAITVEIKNGGKTYIRVTDNGCGIDKGQVELAFKRHATSKIQSEKDLDHIETLGFRGEALASIAAVSRTELITKTREAESGFKLQIEGGEYAERADTGCPDGTTLVVADLFYNTPARLKFMKPDNTESTLIIDFVSKMALAYPNVKLRLINNGNILFSTPGKGDMYTNILTIYSREIGEKLIRVEKQEGDMGLLAFISPPSQSRTNRKSQIFFVNGRWINSKLLESSVSQAYAEKLFDGRYPIAFLFLQVPAQRLDVNIHPNKKEVRFDDEKQILQFVSTALREGLAVKEAVPEIKRENLFRKTDWRDYKETEVTGHTNPVKINITENKNRGTGEQVDIKSFLSTKRQQEQTKLAEALSQLSGKPENSSEISTESKLEILQAEAGIGQLWVAEEAAVYPSEEAAITNEMMDILSEKIESPRKKAFDFSGLTPTGTIFNTYITAIDEEYFYLIDQHAAHERVFYEQLLSAYLREERHSQMLLTPFVVDMPFAVKNNAADFMVYLEKIGYHIEEFGAKAFLVKEIPAMMELAEAEDFLHYFLDNISADFSLQDKTKVDKIIMRACKSAVKANDHLDMQEISALLRDLEKTDNPFSCPHGRPTFIKLSKYEIEKLFKRV